MTNLKSLSSISLTALAICIGCGSSDTSSSGNTTNTGGQVSGGGAGTTGNVAGNAGAGAGGTSAAGGGAGGASAGAAGTTGGSGAGGTNTGGGGAGGANPGGTGGQAGSGGNAGGGAGGAGNAEPSMTFFVTSTGSGALGGNLGGLTGADAICQAAAQAVGEGAKTWHAYLSTAAEDAVDRIGTGPWYNYDLEMVAADLASLHTTGLPREEPNLVMDELGQTVPSGEHDILTGSMEDGTVQTGMTCLDWTSGSDDDMGQVGHSDIPAAQFSPSWNSAHETAGCSESGVEQRGGSGRLYCFAID